MVAQTRCAAAAYPVCEALTRERHAACAVVRQLPCLVVALETSPATLWAMVRTATGPKGFTTGALIIHSSCCLQLRSCFRILRSPSSMNGCACCFGHDPAAAPLVIFFAKLTEPGVLADCVRCVSVVCMSAGKRVVLVAVRLLHAVYPLHC